MNGGRFCFYFKSEVLTVFREMRRKKQALLQDDCIAILTRGTSGVLAVAGDDGYPYAVPLSYVYCEGKLYFHCAPSGHKLDAIAQCDKVSFCVIDRDDVVPEEYTSYFRSVIAFGRAHILEDESEKRAALELLAARYSPDHEQGRQEEIEKTFNRVRLVDVSIEHMTGKEAIELVNQRS